MIEIEKEVKELNSSLNQLSSASSTMLEESNFTMQNSCVVTENSQNLNGVILDLSNKIDEMLKSITTISKNTKKTTLFSSVPT